MALPSASSTRRVFGWIDLENDGGDFLPTRPVIFGVEQTQIGDDVVLVVAGGVRPARCQRREDRVILALQNDGV
jgi:hypothetical protein